MKRKTLFIFYVFFNSVIGFSQFIQVEIISTEPKKNNIFCTVGIWPMYSTIIGNYEGVIFQPSNSIFSAVGIRIAAGYSIIWTSEGGMNYATNIFTLIGRKTNQLEIAAGVLLAPWTSNNEHELFPSFNLSYRFHKPGRPFIFRTGVGWPEAVHFSFGFDF